MGSMMEQLRDAMNAHHPARMAALFADDYVSVQPVHPARGFSGRDQVEANWTSVFEGVPDFTAELVGLSVDGDTEWGEWDWHGRHTDGSPFAMRGVVVLVARHGLVARMRLYMEPVDAGGGGIGEAVRELYRAPE